jgi:hypothetical protein
MFLWCGCAQAANPSFSSFATNHFITNNFLIRARLNPAQFDTNASSITITITNVSNVTGGSLWTNDLGYLRPISSYGGTNDFRIAEVTGWTGAGTNAFFDDGTFQGVAVINPTDGCSTYRVNAYELGDFPWHFNGTNVETFTSAIVGATVIVGTNTLPYWGTPTLESFLSVHDADNGDPNGNDAYIGSYSTNGYGGIDMATRTNSSTISATTTAGGGNTATLHADDSVAYLQILSGATPRTQLQPANTTEPYTFDTSSIISANHTRFRNNGTNTLVIDYRGGLIFGPGTTNVLYRSGAGIVYTNTANNALFSVYGSYLGQNGGAGNPTYSFIADPYSGYYHSSTIHHWTENGAEMMRATWNASPYLNGTTLQVGPGAFAFGTNVTTADLYLSMNSTDRGKFDVKYNTTNTFSVTPNGYAVLPISHTPASSSETNYVGAMTWDASYIYVWTATNVNKRATLNTW